MCGIIAILRQPSNRLVPSTEEIIGCVVDAVGLVNSNDTSALGEAAEKFELANSLLSGVSGLLALQRDPELSQKLVDLLDDIDFEFHITENQSTNFGEGIENANVFLVRIRDAVWALLHDRVGGYNGVCSLASKSHPPSEAGLAVLLSVQQALSAIDRLEVRGRDSAGIQVTIWDHDLQDISESEPCFNDPLYRSGSMRLLPSGEILLVAKVASEIGELGDNTQTLRRILTTNSLLEKALASPAVQGAVLGHTRWASVGLISEANAHPLDSFESDWENFPVVTAVQNGDIDNHLDLVVSENLKIPTGISTDARVATALCAKRISVGLDPLEAFRRTVNLFEGSIAIASSSGDDPKRLMLAVRGSGQALYIGLADDAFVVASEPYGIVELTEKYLRLDGEVSSDLENPISTRGQVIELCAAQSGSLDGIKRFSYDGIPISISDSDIRRAEITTRDIDRGDYPHYLIKEISESPNSVRATLRGRLVEVEGVLEVRLGSETLSDRIRADLSSKLLTRVVVIGQGTAAIAAKSVAASCRAELRVSGISVEDFPATELSGFGLSPDMSDTLVIAISQSGTTTDTNRTVELVRARGARVIAIVNRRNSDLVDRADGVFYTSDGRDVEMSVASTKAFYSQVAAGFLLAVALADTVGVPGSVDRSSLLFALAGLPDDMEKVLEQRGHIADLADRHALSRRHWAVVGSGQNLIAAEEIRIKLSELCYKSISADATEDKKHIDLSSEPLVLVCATGLVGSAIGDVAKEVAIFRAHKAAPVVITDTPVDQFVEALDLIGVPRTHPRISFVLATIAGHLFGYEAARSIDRQAQPLRVAHAAIEKAIDESLSDAGETFADQLLERVYDEVASAASFFFNELWNGRFDGNLESSSAVRLATLFRYVLGQVPLESYQLEFNQVGTPALVLENFAVALTLAIEELTRPVDAIKHQAKTVTVGISRSDETLLEVPLVRKVLEFGTPRDTLSYETLKLLAELNPAVEEVIGFTRYELRGMEDDSPKAIIVGRGGISTEITSRTEKEPELRGTKHRVAVERRVLVTRGDRDDRIILLVPEVRDQESIGLALLHITIRENLVSDTLHHVLRGYYNRYEAIRDAVCETESELDDEILVSQPVIDLLIEPIELIADRFRSLNLK